MFLFCTSESSTPLMYSIAFSIIHTPLLESCCTLRTLAYFLYHILVMRVCLTRTVISTSSRSDNPQNSLFFCN